MLARFSLSGGKIGCHVRFYLLPTSRDISLLGSRLRNRSKFIVNSWLSVRLDTQTRYVAVNISRLHVIATWRQQRKFMICSGIISKPFSHNYLRRAARDSFFTNLTLITSKQSCRFIGYGAGRYLNYLCLFLSPHNLHWRHVHSTT